MKRACLLESASFRFYYILVFLV